MQLSIIIVNFNVRYFLEQCLLSISKSRQDIDLEIIVVDNNSSDDSKEMVRSRFPGVHLIENSDNKGFSAANNQAIQLASGKYVLLLNPDTILSEDTLARCYQFMESHEDAGAVCVRMIDGSGRYLPESKRGKPTLAASFFKMTGLYRLAPRSQFFNGYYAGHLDPDKMAAIEVMTGAFMFIRKDVIDRIGLLDDTFFMYGEDIDYSYRILEAGYKNYYLPSTTIIHFKGESTKKSTLNYTKIFYNAMIIFVRKHYKGKNYLFVLLLQLAVILKAMFSYFLERLLNFLPLLIDISLIWLILINLKKWWGQIYFNNINHINLNFDHINAPIYAAIWGLSLYVTGYYRKNAGWLELIKGIAGGTVLILIFYALLEPELRNSRTLILWGSITTFCLTLLTKWSYNFLFSKSFGFIKKKNIKYAIIAHAGENNRIREMISKSRQKTRYVGRINPGSELKDDALGQLIHLNEIVNAYNLDEVIFSQKDVPAYDMMKSMAGMPSEVYFRVAPDDTLSIISSRDKDKQGELLTVGLNFNLSFPGSLFNKRLLDIIISFLILLFCPLFILLFRGSSYFVSNMLAVLSGKKTLIGYAQPIDYAVLPVIKPGIIPCTDIGYSESTDDIIRKENLYYARNYSWYKDLEIVLKNINRLNGKYN